MNIKEIIIKNYPLVAKVDIDIECYMVSSYEYIVFWNDLIHLSELKNILKFVYSSIYSIHRYGAFAFTVIGKTNDAFNNDELISFYASGSASAFYIYDEINNITYFKRGKIPSTTRGCKKMILSIDKIVSKEL